ncbi:hypothetical protein HKBW3S44_00972 [Candidatus Hakubella thermalkaliphila]|uniref:Uncharacterized protein n=1 Tax=Candidatus Hakubella thermalkaliphila TaxID=2754717 RepID=A0A6V8PDA4_9ACTN|nr:hypothetical protein HKBW3S09_00272 [Candidatus Hakubella thermalkaliphila]GFP30699.1 hypothetical protein HKBW3S34_01619 [Candidatus Hakubella thermalkaliphila]GFP37292.1 hypothetical protein HKBW3S44_00972 [Candidatus Hakubella thermalkaliphila]GFP39692.1 hypothetical protein HKBW3S47_01390 [Candidatus Hakubella thermalkaliphila]
MPLNLHFADMLKVDPLTINPSPVTVGGKLNGIKPSPSFKARITRLLPSLDAAKEGLKSLTQPAQSGLAGREVGCRKIGVGYTSPLHPGGLLSVLYRALVLLPSVLSLRQGVVVQTTMCFKHLRHSLSLSRVRIQSVLERLTHLRLLSLSLDVFPNHIFRYMTGRAYVVAPAPQTRHSPAQVRKLLPKNSRRVAFELISEMLRRISQRRGDKQVNVVWPDLQAFNLYVKFLSFLVKKRLEMFGDQSREYVLAVFWAPYKMIM